MTLTFGRSDADCTYFQEYSSIHWATKCVRESPLNGHVNTPTFNNCVNVPYVYFTCVSLAALMRKSQTMTLTAYFYTQWKNLKILSHEYIDSFRWPDQLGDVYYALITYPRHYHS